MDRFDMHVHACATPPQPEALLEQMARGGISGGCVFSNRPQECDPAGGSPFGARLEEALAWTQGYENRLFPVLWIHPHEKDLPDKIRTAVESGIDGFKIICTDFYVYEPACLRALEEIAKWNRPVFFHSGILWDGKVSADYNKPMNWEALIRIENLRFSMGHCSWPWYDECIALYGKLLNAFAAGTGAEMFFDLTPGTPAVYRRDLLTKLYTVGYDVPDNLLFGTDSSAANYQPRWAEKWLTLDGEILDSLGISQALRQKLYHDNLLRFLGKTPKTFRHMTVASDGITGWSPDCSRP